MIYSQASTRCTEYVRILGRERTVSPSLEGAVLRLVMAENYADVGKSCWRGGESLGRRFCGKSPFDRWDWNVSLADFTIEKE